LLFPTKFHNKNEYLITIFYVVSEEKSYQKIGYDDYNIIKGVTIDLATIDHIYRASLDVCREPWIKKTDIRITPESKHSWKCFGILAVNQTKTHNGEQQRY
jgi:hypothetical protein